MFRKVFTKLLMFALVSSLVGFVFAASRKKISTQIVNIEKISHTRLPNEAVIKAPMKGYSSQVSIIANVLPANATVKKLLVYYDDGRGFKNKKLMGTISPGEYQCTLSLPRKAESQKITYYLVADDGNKKVYDGKGGQNYTFTVKAPPYLKIDYPKQNQIITSKEYKIKIGAGGANNVRIKIDNGDWTQCERLSGIGKYVFNWTNYADGKHTISAEAFDELGQHAETSKRTVKVKLSK